MLLENASRVGVLTHTRTETALLLGEVLASEPPGFCYNTITPLPTQEPTHSPKKY
jgi:hypothetical protein